MFVISCLFIANKGNCLHVSLGGGEMKRWASVTGPSPRWFHTPIVSQVLTLIKVCREEDSGEDMWAAAMLWGSRRSHQEPLFWFCSLFYTPEFNLPQNMSIKIIIQEENRKRHQSNVTCLWFMIQENNKLWQAFVFQPEVVTARDIDHLQTLNSKN